MNALSGRKALANVSKTPGRTQLINVFAIESGGALVDLPGFGYANVSKAVRSTWPEMIESFLLESPDLRMVLALVDGEIGPAKLDVQLLAWLREHQLPHQVVATKHDKVKSSQPRAAQEGAVGRLSARPQRRHVGQRGQGHGRRGAARPDTPVRVLILTRYHHPMARLAPARARHGGGPAAGRLGQRVLVGASPPGRSHGGHRRLVRPCGRP